MRIRLFGKHIHNQIVVPLVVALTLVGILASVVGTALLGQVIQRWVAENAAASSATLSTRLQDKAQQMQRGVKLQAQDLGFQQAVAQGDRAETAAGVMDGYRLLKSTQTAYQARYDTNLMMLGSNGVVLASAGSLGLNSGQVPFSADSINVLGSASGRSLLLKVAESQTLTALETVAGPDGKSYLLAYSVVIDDGFVSSLAADKSSEVALYDDDEQLLGTLVSGSSSLSPVERTLRSTYGELTALLGSARHSSGAAVTKHLKLQGTSYRIAAQYTTLPGDPGRQGLYLVSVLSTEIADQVQTTATVLIILWSLIAVALLVFLNVWVARRVSDPLAALSTSVRQVAEGDLTVKVPYGGDNEIGDLGADFNRMTESMRERTETLTTKASELKSLYEMSCSLGSTLDLDVLLDSVLASVQSTFHAEMGYVTLRNAETGELQVRAWRGGSVEPLSAMSSSMCDWVIREGRPLIFNPVDDVEDSRELMSGAQAALCVPLNSSEGAIGAITVGTRDAEHRFTGDDVRLLATVANQVAVAVGNVGLFSSLQEAYLATVKALAAAVDAKDPFTRGHSEQVAHFSLAIADAMGLSAEQLTALEMAAYLHDIGKIGIPEEILLKPGVLTDEEMAQMRHHPLIGASILRPVAFPWPITPLVRHHHEHFDGSGYPAGLRGEEIPLLARVLTVADAFEAMIADRPYRRGRSREEAILELRRCSGTHFDPRIVDALIAVQEEDLAHRVPVEHDIADHEAQQAMLVAVCNGMMTSFRRLGGPRLSSNLEQDVNDAFVAAELRCKVLNGRLVMIDGCKQEPRDEGLRLAMEIISSAMERTSGASLVCNFRSDAVAGLPERMRVLAEEMQLFHDQ